MKRLSEADLAWAAGIYEGEGNTAIADFRPGMQLGTLRASVTNSDLDIVAFFQDNWPGYVYDREARSDQHRPTSRWTVQSLKAQAFLLDIQPYIKSDRKQKIVRIGLAFQTHKSRDPSINRSSSYREAGELLRAEMTALNTLGPVHV